MCCIVYVLYIHCIHCILQLYDLYVIVIWLILRHYQFETEFLIRLQSHFISTQNLLSWRSLIEGFSSFLVRENIISWHLCILSSQIFPHTKVYKYNLWDLSYFLLVSWGYTQAFTLVFYTHLPSIITHIV